MEEFVKTGLVNTSKNFGVNQSKINLSDITTLDNVVAENMVTQWYQNSTSNDADKFIIMHMMFIIMFLELLENYILNIEISLSYILFEYLFSLHSVKQCN